MSKVSLQVLDLAVRCGLSYDTAYLILLCGRKEVVTHVQRLKACLPSEDNEKWSDALFSELKPVDLIPNFELLKRAEIAISKRAHEVIAFLCGARRAFEAECVQAGGLGRKLAAKVEHGRATSRVFWVQAADLKLLQEGRPCEDLTERPFLNGVIFI